MAPQKPSLGVAEKPLLAVAVETSSSESESSSDEEVMPPSQPTNLDSDSKDSSDEEEAMPSPKRSNPKVVVVAKSQNPKQTNHPVTDDDDEDPIPPTSNLKRKREDEEEKSTKKLFQRLFTEQDEITILEGIHNYIANNDGKNPLNDIEVEPSFKKPHDRNYFDLSKKIWTVATKKTKETKAKTVLKSETGVEKFDADERALHIEQLKLFTENTKMELEKAQLVLKVVVKESTHTC
ncbi:hypothetical protein ACFE04_023893 [Oxalis oulophora]